ncbi:MAG: hypothetical protein Q7K55_08765 [Candidatus Levybacteria bacterium]|nr:hypothetical protein [Candidatus Levybacteria bacterium]
MDITESRESINPELSDSSTPIRSRSKGLILFILLILILGGLISFSSLRKEGQNPTPSPKPSNIPVSSSSKMIVYGVWKDNKSYIKGYNEELKKEYLVAELPFNIKKISMISPNILLYISDINSNDHGENISLYDLLTKTSSIIYNADSDFGIDDYVVSKNGRYLSVWEVSLNPQSKVLLGGKSRVYSADLSLNNSVSILSKNLIYDEVANNPVHYPRAILSNGTIFFDTFFPNSGAGWAFGMSLSDFKGTKKQEISNMSNGSYGTQPSISPNEEYFVFSGYSKGEGEGKKEDKDGFRNALVSPDTIEVLNTQTLNRTKLPNILSENIYPSSYFDKESGNIVFFAVSKDESKTGTYIYNFSSGLVKKIDFLSDNVYVSGISPNDILVGEKSQSVSAIGNLGSTYTGSFTKFSIVNTLAGKTTPLKISDSFMQFIFLAPPSYVSNAAEINMDSENSLQLKTFNLKPSLEKEREKQQHDPTVDRRAKCKDLIKNQCGISLSQANPTDAIFNKCIRRLIDTNPICFISPLYLYGKTGTKVNIKAKTYIYSKDPIYDEKTGYNITIKDNGKMEVNGKIYDRINYDYLSKNVTPPEYGIITTKEKLPETLSFFSQNLGLNQKETNDLIDFGKSNISSPFVFVSFFDQKTSENILPLEFIPKPDTYINIVFYFKEYQQKPSIKPQELKFPSVPKRIGLAPRSPAPLDEVGFTAVEISEILE